MSTMISEVYDALKDAGAAEEKARAAAEVLSNYESRFTKIESDLAAFRAEVRGEFTLLRWMVGFLLAIGVTLLFKAFA